MALPRLATEPASAASGFWLPPSSYLLKPDDAPNLQETRRTTAAQERTQNASGRADGIDTQAEIRIGNVVDRLIEVHVIEKVVGLRPEREGDLLGDLQILHQRHVDVEEVRSGNGVASDCAKSRECACRSELCGSEARRVYVVGTGVGDLRNRRGKDRTGSHVKAKELAS